MSGNHKYEEYCNIIESALKNSFLDKVSSILKDDGDVSEFINIVVKASLKTIKYESKSKIESLNDKEFNLTIHKAIDSVQFKKTQLCVINIDKVVSNIFRYRPVSEAKIIFGIIKNLSRTIKEELMDKYKDYVEDISDQEYNLILKDAKDTFLKKLPVYLRFRVEIDDFIFSDDIMIKNSFKEKLLFREQTINYALAEDLSMPESTELTDDEYNEMLKKAKNLVKSIRNPLGYIDFIIKFD